MEVLARYLAQIETAAARNPRSPDFHDLDAVTGTTVDESGCLILPEYAKYIAHVQEATLKMSPAASPLPPVSRVASGAPRSRGAPRRHNEAIVSLNTLDVPTAGSQRSASVLPATAVQASINERVCRRVASFGEPPAEATACSHVS